jgi:hypothetical protein
MNLEETKQWLYEREEFVYKTSFSFYQDDVGAAVRLAKATLEANQEYMSHKARYICLKAGVIFTEVPEKQHELGYN